MKRGLIQLAFFTTIFFVSFPTMAQNIYENPGTYMTALSQAHEEMDSKYMAYTSAVAHGKRAKKVEKLRLQVLDNINNTKYKVLDLPPFKGDNSLRKSQLEYIDFCYKIFNDDYSKIVNTEEIAEQSFDEMQAFILLQQKVDEKLKLANESLHNATKVFAAKYTVNLIEGEKSVLGEKLEQAGKVSKYYNPVFLIFFKTSFQNRMLNKALNENRMNDAEQARNAVIKYADEGLAELQKIAAFQGDGTLKGSCVEALKTFKQCAVQHAPILIDFALKKEQFEKLKKLIDQKSNDERTKEDIDNFNKVVKEFNASVQKSNTNSNQNTEKINTAYSNWEKTVTTFFDINTPKHR